MNEEEKPLETSPEWSDYVMRQFTDDELVKTEKGEFPKVSGLRRVVELLVGPIVESGVENYQIINNGMKTVCLYKVAIKKAGDKIILWDCPNKIFKGLASAGPENVLNNFSIFPEAMAETRAEVRALRKALKLRVCGAEELSEVPSEVDGYKDEGGEQISKQQKSFLIAKCQQLNISINKLLGVNNESELDRIPKSKATEFARIISDYQKDMSSIPDNLKVS
jgi:hypothetical protein